VRADFQSTFDPQELGERTLIVANQVADKISELDPALADQALDLAVRTISQAGVKISMKDFKSEGEVISRPQTGALLFASRPQIEALARLAIANPDEAPAKKDAQQALRDGVTVDVALFGRMIADAPELNVDACAQVAHALSVHAVDTEYDYFTAVDDNAPEGNAGAGMIGTVEFNSSTLYRYATLNVDEFVDTLGSVEVAARGAGEFVRSFVRSMPTGKQNTFANRTLPEVVLLVVRGDQPVNLVGAFEEPVESLDGRATAATKRMLDRFEEIQAVYGGQPKNMVALAVGKPGSAFEAAGLPASTLEDLVTAAADAVRASREG